MRLLISTSGSIVLYEILQFCKQFIDRIGEPPTLLITLDPYKDRPSIQYEAYQKQASQILGANHLDVCTRFVRSIDELVKESRKGSYDLLILGDLRSSWLREKITRSSTERIAEQASCPVMLVRGRTGLIRKVLFCVSGADELSLVGKFNAKLACLLDGSEDITVLHVMSQISVGPDVHGEQLSFEAHDLIEAHTREGDILIRDVNYFSAVGFYSKPKVRHGLVVDEILSEAQNGNYDLVVIGAFVHKGWGHFLFDDLAHKILAQIECPVLVVH
jgi:nucleotide-binding universal stress UspA family protein